MILTNVLQRIILTQVGKKNIMGYPPPQTWLAGKATTNRLDGTASIFITQYECFIWEDVGVSIVRYPPVNVYITMENHNV